MVSIYIHIPFCKKICSYCDFCKLLYTKKWITPYLEALKNEIADRYNGEQVDTLYIGGGSPSCLEIEQLKQLWEIIKNFKLNNNYEFTVECNLDDLNQDKLIFLKSMGVNRLSIGIQSFNPNKLKLLNRYHTFSNAKNIISTCRNLGFNNINLDFIYGVPNETYFQLKRDIRQILKLKPNHLSAYSLIIEPNTILKINNFQSINDDIEVKMYKYINKRAKKNKLFRYEISNFSEKGKESLHNLNYWNNNEYYGFGI